MKAKKIIPIFLLLVVLALFLWARVGSSPSASPEAPDEQQAADVISPTPELPAQPSVPETPAEPAASAEPSAPAEPTEPTEPAETPVDIKTIGGVVLVGKIAYDEKGWHFQPDQPLNISYEYFLDSPSEFLAQTRVSMFDPKDDGVEKAHYLGQTVTAAGTFQFFRDDFETLYFMPYTITIGKSAEQSYSAPELTYPDEPANLYDPDRPLPKYVDPMIIDGRYVYNTFALSRETIEFMGNDFVTFYVDFVDAFLSYRSEVECPEKRFAEMLSTVIYYEFPLYAACAEPFEFFKSYDSEKGTVTITYLYDEQTHDEILAKFLERADELLEGTSPEKTDAENAKSIYHALSTSVTYDYSALEEFERKESYYAYLNGSGVCVTFANVYNQLLTQLGIKTTLAHCDTSDSMGHSWSVVTLDGQQYFCDPTYELSYDSGSGYRFFGMNYAERTANGLGELGIRYGRYYMRPMDAAMLAEKSLGK